MTVRKAIVMALLLAVSAALLWRYEASLEEGDTAVVEAEERKAFFHSIQQSELSKVKVIRESDSYGLKRLMPETAAGAAKQPAADNSPWVLDRPEGAPTDQQRVSKLLGDILSLRPANTLSEDEVGKDHGAYGLAPPELVLTLEGSFGKRILSFGKEHPVSKRRYVQFEEDPQIYLVAPEVFTALALPAQELRDRKPARFDPATVVAVVALRPGELPLAFKRQPPREDSPFERWTLQSGETTVPVDGDLFRKELHELASLEATEFIDDGAERLPVYGLANPELSIRVDCEEPGAPRKEIMIHIGKGLGLVSDTSDPENITVSRAAYYFKLSDSPLIYRFERPTFSDWLQPAEHFRTRTPFNSLSFDDVEKAILSVKGEQFTIIKSSMEEDGTLHWELEADGKRSAADSERVESWLEEVFTLKVLSYPALSVHQDAYGFDTPELRIDLVAPAQPETPQLIRSIFFGNPLEPSVSTSGAEPASEPRPDAPRYAGIQENETLPVPAVVSAETVTGLHKPRAYFSGQ